mmetsp:Transcript_13117/g.33481  ORF Transcript_13117/g.33481 Transcript_13117/m.33481 type:complete len:349 (+) Transcript_13117:1220-2266(+)
MAVAKKLDAIFQYSNGRFLHTSCLDNYHSCSRYDHWERRSRARPRSACTPGQQRGTLPECSDEVEKRRDSCYILIRWREKGNSQPSLAQAEGCSRKKRPGEEREDRFLVGKETGRDRVRVAQEAGSEMRLFRRHEARPRNLSHRHILRRWFHSPVWFHSRENANPNSTLAWHGKDHCTVRLRIAGTLVRSTESMRHTPSQLRHMLWDCCRRHRCNVAANCRNIHHFRPDTLRSDLDRNKVMVGRWTIDRMHRGIKQSIHHNSNTVPQSDHRAEIHSGARIPKFLHKLAPRTGPEPVHRCKDCRKCRKRTRDYQDKLHDSRALSIGHRNTQASCTQSVCCTEAGKWRPL